MSTRSFISTKGQGHWLTLVQMILIYPQHSGERYRTIGPLVENFNVNDSTKAVRLTSAHQSLVGFLNPGS